MNEADAAFLRALETCQIQNSQFGHRDHLRAAWIYVMRYGAAQAAPITQRAIMRFAAHHGHTGKYHATLTAAWVCFVAIHAAYHPSDLFDDFLAQNSELLDKNLPLRFYSRERLFSDVARARWMEPDLRPFPVSR